MDITPSGNLRIVLSGPLRLTKARLGEWSPVEQTILAAVVDAAASDGGIAVRAREADEHAIQIFSLIGTSESTYPLELIRALDLPPDPFKEALRPALRLFTGRGSPFRSAKLLVAVLRIFGNGYAALVVTVELTVRRDIGEAEYLRYLADRFDYTGKAAVKFRTLALHALRETIYPLCKSIVRRCGLAESELDGELDFVSTFYVLAADWDPLAGEELAIDARLRPMLQPEARENLVNQSSSRSELIFFSSGCHMYVWNRRTTPDPRPRTISLVSFLSLMNILYDQLDAVKEATREKLKANRIAYWEQSDLDDQIEILYRQALVSCLSWRQDFSSFSQEIERRWKLSELKQYCLALLSEVEARSARKRRTIVQGIIIVITGASMVSIVADGYQLVGQASNSARSELSKPLDAS